MGELLTVGKLKEFLKNIPDDYEIVNEYANNFTSVAITDIWSPWDEGTDKEHYKAVILRT